MDPFGERSPKKVMMGVGLGQASFSVSSLDDRRIGNTSARFSELYGVIVDKLVVRFRMCQSAC